MGRMCITILWFVSLERSNGNWCIAARQLHSVSVGLVSESTGLRTLRRTRT